jgi:ribonuclease P protein component
MLPRGMRLKQNRDFRAVYNRRTSFATPTLVLYVRMRPRPSDADSAVVRRLGFVVSKKLARRAHDRNRIKRRLREACRVALLPKIDMGIGFDALFVARTPSLTSSFARLAADIEILTRQAGLLLRGDGS